MYSPPLAGPEWGEEGGPGEHERRKRQTTEAFTFNIMKTRCPLLLVADYRFYKDMGSRSTKTTINYLVRRATVSAAGGVQGEGEGRAGRLNCSLTLIDAVGTLNR